MSATNYATINGRIVAETGTNGVSYYHTDALGSVTTTSDQNGNKLNEYRYKPYGTMLSKSGAAADPLFQWVGSQGYRSNNLSYSNDYVRQRHYSPTDGRWTSMDILWPKEPAFNYCRQDPARAIDPTGMALATLSVTHVLSACGVNQVSAYVEYIASFNLTFPPNFGSKAGAIVQHNKAFFLHFEDCETGYEHGLPTDECWEAWKVDENGAISPTLYLSLPYKVQVPYNDTWGSPFATKCTYWHGNPTGDVAYIQGMKLGKAGGACGQGSNYPLSMEPPGWKNPSSNVVSRSITQFYTQCPDCPPNSGTDKCSGG